MSTAPSVHAYDLRHGQLSDENGLSLYQAALHAKDKKAFRDKIMRSISAYKRAQIHYRKLRHDERGRLLRSQAMEKFLTYWIARSPSEKKQLLDESWRLTKESLRYLEAREMGREYADTYYHLSRAVAIGVYYEDRVEDRVRKLTETIEPGRKSVRILQTLGKREELARVLTRTALFLDSLADRCSDPNRINLYQREALKLWEDARRNSEEAATRETAGPPDGFYRILDHGQNLTLVKRALTLVRSEHDNLATGWLLNRLAHYTFWESDASQSPDTPLKLLDKALRYAEESAEHYDRINFTNPVTGVLWTHSPYTEYFLQRSSYEEDADRARLLLEKSVRASTELLRFARKTGCPDIVQYALHVKSKAETSLAAIETKRLRKKRLLQTALAERGESASIVQKIEPKINWNVGVAFAGLARIQVRLSELEKNPKTRKELLLQAVASKERGLACNTKFVGLLERSEGHVLRGPLGNGYRELGDLLLQLVRVTHDDTYIRRAATSFVESSEWFRSIRRQESTARSHWRAAESYDLMRLFTLSSEQFSRASRAYIELAKKIPSLKEFSNDYSRYMRAWSEIEQARSRHVKLDFSQATQHYSTASRLHRSTMRWRFLAPYYSAWAGLEQGEALSKDGYREEAARAFSSAAAAFAESRVSLRERLSHVDPPDEMQMIGKLAESRRDIYCQARALIEEAVLAESKGDYQVSSEKFMLAADQLKQAAQGFESHEAEETTFLSTLCQAWRLSSMAEDDDFSAGLEEAQTLFEKAAGASPSKEAGELAAGHIAFCTALIASRGFAKTRRQSIYEKASRQYDEAAQHYLNLGFRIACYHAIAQKLFVDASAKIILAESETDRAKRAQQYRLTIGLLSESARMFGKANQLNKKERTLSLLRKVGMESQIAENLSEILNAASTASTNIAFHTPSRGDERAVGLDRFENADLDVKLTISPRPQPEDGLVESEIEILNISDGPVKILKLEDAIPAQAKLSEISIKATTQDRSLVPEELRIPPKEIEKIRLSFSTTESLISLRPKVLFQDSSGSKRDRMIEPKILPGSSIIRFLAGSFIRDYTERKLEPNSCGWRTLMQIVNGLKIPKSHVYGEPRYGRAFGKQFDRLVRTSLVEYRVFPGERGRGGEITKTRVHMENQLIKNYIQQSIDAMIPGSVYP